MRITQGTFSFLPDLTDDEILLQIQYALDHGWALSVEFTDDPHPRNHYWDMWGLPMFDLPDAAGVLYEVNECRKAYPQRYIRVNAYDAAYDRQTTALSFLVNRPFEEPGFRLERQELADRRLRYTLHPYAADRPAGDRYPLVDGNGAGRGGAGDGNGGGHGGSLGGGDVGRQEAGGDGHGDGRRQPPPGS